MLADIRRCIADAGFTPVRRDPHWGVMTIDEVPAAARAS
jgi:hypothetical protein